MFEFEAKFLLKQKQGFQTTGTRLPMAWSRHAQEIMAGTATNQDGSPKYHKDGEVTQPVVLQSLTGLVDIVSPVRDKKNRDAEIVSTATAIAGLFTKAPGEPGRSPRPIGSQFPINIPIRIVGAYAVATTVHPITSGDATFLTDNYQLPLSEWEKMVFEKSGIKWVPNPLEQQLENARLSQIQAEKDKVKEDNKKLQLAKEKENLERERDRTEEKIKELKRSNPKNIEKLTNLTDKLDNILFRIYEIEDAENSKISCLKTSKNRYNSVSEDHMKLAGGTIYIVTEEEMKAGWIEDGTVANQEEADALLEQINADCENED